MSNVKGFFAGVLCLAVLAPISGFCSYKNKILNIVDNPSLRGTRIGIDVQVLGSRKELFSFHSEIPLIPASNLKILSSGCSLVSLGRDYRFTTAVLGGPMEAGVMSGNLVLRGNGDPTWSSDFYPRATTPLTILAQKLKEQGLKIIEGDLVIDDSIFSREFVGKGWKSRYQWEDYATEIGALSVNKNQVRVIVTPGNFIGATPQVTFNPPNHVMKITNDAVTTNSITTLSFSRNRENNQVIIRGKIARHNPGLGITFNIHNPSLFAGSVFAEMLKDEGISLKGRVRLIESSEIGHNSHLMTLASVQSPPLLTIVHRMNKESDNFLAEHLFRTLGAARFGKGTIQNGGQAIADCIGNLGYTEATPTFADGSGLSDRDRVSAKTFVEVLQGIAALPIGKEFKNTLPRGCADGTLEDRLCGVNVSAKTGAIRGVNTLSGYLITKKGETLVFSILLNNHPGSSEYGREIIDSIVKVLANSPDV